MRTLAYKQALRKQAASGRGIVRHAARLRLGEISQDEFLRATSEDWRRLARTLHNAYRGKLPDSLGVEDLAQEMQLEALRVYPAWNPNGRPIGDYLVYNGCSKARKTLNRERGAENRDGKKPSRFALPESRLGRRSFDGEQVRSIFDRESTDADQELRAAGRELYLSLRRELGEERFAEEIRSLGEGGAAARRAVRNNPAIARAIERMRRGEIDV